MSPKGFERGSLPLSNDTSANLSDPSKGGNRCFGDGDPLYARYHDEEWGRPIVDEHGLYERMSLEGFQSGLSWLTILRKREAFRAAFSGFDPVRVAAYDAADVERWHGRRRRRRAGQRGGRYDGHWQ